MSFSLICFKDCNACTHYQPKEHDRLSLEVDCALHIQDMSTKQLMMNRSVQSLAENDSYGALVMCSNACSNDWRPRLWACCRELSNNCSACLDSMVQVSDARLQLHC